MPAEEVTHLDQPVGPDQQIGGEGGTVGEGHLGAAAVAGVDERAQLLVQIGGAQGGR